MHTYSCNSVAWEPAVGASAALSSSALNAILLAPLLNTGFVSTLFVSFSFVDFLFGLFLFSVFCFCLSYIFQLFSFTCRSAHILLITLAFWPLSWPFTSAHLPYQSPRYTNFSVLFVRRGVCSTNSSCVRPIRGIWRLICCFYAALLCSAVA